MDKLDTPKIESALNEGVFGSEERGGNQTLCGHLALKRSVGLLDEKHLTKISSLVEVELAVNVNCFVDLTDRGQIDQGRWEGDSIN